ncbi:MAG: DNA repair protein RadC, partial [Clostridia bacterium]|nr:DNA repair protein RadC [Clostridia bacterium]
KRLKQNGVSSFFDHELLEMLLYFAIPRGDTNPTAHNLLSEFKSLDGILKADEADLKGINGIGDKTAILLLLAGEISRRSKTTVRPTESFRIKNVETAVKYCSALFADKKYECFHAVCMDIKGCVISDGFICEGVIDRVPAYTRRIVETALRHRAYSVILAHNHPGGKASPSSADDNITAMCKTALESIGITLNDHIIIGEDGHYSYSGSGELDKLSNSNGLNAAQKNN